MSFIKNRELIGDVPHVGHFVSNNQQRGATALFQIEQQSSNDGSRNGIDTVPRIIEQKNGRITSECPRESEKFAHPDRKINRHFVAVPFQADSNKQLTDFFLNFTLQLAAVVP
jgi:hypothetical protein